MSPEEQKAEVNRVVNGIIDTGLRSLGVVQTREATMALVLLAIQLNLNATPMTKEEIRVELRNMLDWLLENAVILERKDIN